MPLINGQKMACEPCIRGHRSTKCTHANERLMVPPGRPLSTCPHPPARGCGCGSVTAAIPRKQKCGCGSSNGTPTTESPGLVKAESPASDVPPMSPTKAPAASFRVQKTAAKSASRKQSFDPANLERMDAANINLLPPYDMAQSNHIPQASVAAMPPIPSPRPTMEYGAMPIMPGVNSVNGVNGTYHHPIMYPMFTQQMTAPMFPHGPPMSMSRTNGAASATSTSKPAPPPAPVVATNGGSCCSGKANGAVKPTPPPPSLTSTSTGGSCCSAPSKAEGTSTQPSSVSSSPKTQPKPKTGGCCSNKAPTIDTNVGTNGHHISNDHMSPSSAIAMSPFQTPIGMPQGMYQSYFQPTIFTYPPQYGSFMSPLQPEQWKQTMEALQYGQPMPQPAAYAMPPNPLYTPNGTASTIPESTSHTCGCGDGCQCVGCAAHPYNDATQDYVRSAYFSMQEDSYGVTNGANGANGHSESVVANGTGVHTSGDAGGSPPAPQTPSDAASGLSEEQALSASDFFFVTYPFSGEGCAGETLSCPCGDDCQCLGCSIHNNSPVPES
ncbi:LOW QUALITY PROTEIN: Copper fist DNA binding domain-containing protein [Colletotrichum higginsianum IMI 349063]|uniref:Copper fist DNA binding domain-containing protein n=1 Tax=Colletotrichum higginsianum (strain IMI 349063) TaxID=759273 RepID=A0A1B7XSU0_COLHI|nr:LOW QUALITY PROTEIN: Copper fist DNA binding domain-containing protein [Colletotrichum higginsianum IMI 349063]OBR02829.1 LOW QUALITY PROTEIN: Copper fist DNA binding domain-containing protein [Colletotrichum higginsianum IMI 349063]GJD00790.1 copper fist DNA binding domain-containing protein [Colletotrichum higginsianum]